MNVFTFLRPACDPLVALEGPWRFSDVYCGGLQESFFRLADLSFGAAGDIIEVRPGVIFHLGTRCVDVPLQYCQATDVLLLPHWLRPCIASRAQHSGQQQERQVTIELLCIAPLTTMSGSRLFTHRDGEHQQGHSLALAFHAYAHETLCFF